MAERSFVKEVEKLRLGDRLNVEWEIVNVPDDIKVPPLMLQPLLENAVYHGIEPSGEDGNIRIRFARNGDELQIDLTNPCHGAAGGHSGNQMALANIRERLALFYDLEARLDARSVELPGGTCEYRVHISLPCRSQKS